MNSKTTKTALGTFLFRLLLCVLLYLASSLVCSGICFATKNPTGLLKLFAPAAFLFSGALAGYLFGKKDGSFSAYLPLVAFAMILLLLSFAVKETKLSLSVPINLFGYLAVGVLFWTFGRSVPEKKKRKKYGKYH